MSILQSSNSLRARFDNKRFWIVLVLSTFHLAGCTTAPNTQSNSGRYAISQDRGPTTHVDIQSIPEVVPVPEARTRAGNKSPYEVNGKTYYIMGTEEGYRETGIASWYGEKFHGYKTSNGEIYDMYEVTAAHKTLPIPSYVRVTNLDNNRTLMVRVNDRGPFHEGRIIDLSYAAAAKLGYADMGTARVEVEAVIPSLANSNYPSTEPKLPGSESRYLQVGAFSSLQAARDLSRRLRQLTDKPVIIRSVRTDNMRNYLHRVRIGPITDSREIKRITDKLLAEDLGRPFTVNE